ncbi:hypothetical protein K457DRAFT_126759 [Linnemannia elongata AG-77]|uniref:Uncharacterized protein n=1 Tax=Linnemannia elongata AG-77 TaxID=1314771 RepID=A0A197JT29_9FUNG|nr:hypothetical protein K457DRAFT_126759 [Linnemannia elongata AG-77]
MRRDDPSPYSMESAFKRSKSSSSSALVPERRAELIQPIEAVPVHTPASLQSIVPDIADTVLVISSPADIMPNESTPEVDLLTVLPEALSEVLLVWLKAPSSWSRLPTQSKESCWYTLWTEAPPWRPVGNDGRADDADSRAEVDEVEAGTQLPTYTRDATVLKPYWG